MKHLKQIFQALLGVVALILTAIVAFGRLVWRTIRNWWNSRSRWLRRSIVTLFILIPVGYIALMAYAMYEDEYGRDYWDDRLSRNIVAHSYSDNKYRVYNESTKSYTTQKIDWVVEPYNDDTLAVYAVHGRRGYINVESGEIVIDAMANDYNRAWVFSEDLAAVESNGKIGFINRDNELVIPFKFDFLNNCDMEIYFLFHQGCCSMTNAEGKVGLIDTAGNWVVEPIYDELWAPRENGYRIIVNDGKFGVLDPQYNVLYSTTYSDVTILSDGFVLASGGNMWQVDFDGNVVHPFMYDCTYYLNYPIGYDEYGERVYALADYVKYEVMNCYGIMNRITGEFITPAIYSDINMLSEDLFEVQEYDGYDWYLLDTKGNVVPHK